MKPTRSLFFATILCSLTVSFVSSFVEAKPTVAKKVFRWSPDDSGTKMILDDRFAPFQAGFERLDDGVFLCDNGDDLAAARGIAKSIELNQTKAQPLVASAWSKAENVGGSPDVNYSIYIDIIFQDGTPLWGQNVPFPTGTGDWERRTLTVVPTKPVKSLTFYAIFRSHTGKAYFKDLQLETTEISDQISLFDALPIEWDDARNDDAFQPLAPESGVRRSLQIRNVAEQSDFLEINDAFSPAGTAAFDVAVRATSADEPPTATSPFFSRQTIELESRTDQDRALTLIFAVRPNDALPESRVWFENPRRCVSIDSDREYVESTTFPVGANGRLSLYPFGAIGYRTANDSSPSGLALGIDPQKPLFYRVGYFAPSNELYLACDLALTKEAPKATVELVLFDVPDARNDVGFRKALQIYYERFPESFDCRTPEQGIWQPFAKISDVQGWEDFGFKFKEGNNETDWDDAHNIITFRYTEPMTYWLAAPDGAPKTVEASLEQVRNLAANGDRTAQALLTSGHYNAAGELCGIRLDTPWCDGVVWSLNDAPGLVDLAKSGRLAFSDEYPIAGFELKWSDEIADQLYGKAIPNGNESNESSQAGNGAVPGLDGEYIDSSEGYVTAVLNYRRDHFCGAQTPLVFDSQTFAPGIFRGLIAFEYARQMSKDVHARGRLMMANSTPGRFFWLVPQLDVLGTETNWNIDGRWSPTNDADLIYRRAICRHKPYCFLMNTKFDEFSYEATEKYMKRALAYGTFPGFFSFDASTGHYFENPKLYNRDRALFKKYIPLCKKVAEAGWEPISSATTNDEAVYVERFGRFDSEVFFTVFNDSDQTKTVEISFNDDAESLSTSGGSFWQTLRTQENLSMRDLVGGGEFPVRNQKTTLRLEPESVAVLQLIPSL